MRHTAHHILLLLLLGGVCQADIAGTLRYMRNAPAAAWRDGSAMAQSNAVQGIVDYDGDSFDPPYTNAVASWLGDDDRLSEHAGTAPAVGYNKNTFNTNYLNAGWVISDFLRSDTIDDKAACMRIYSALAVPSAAYYVDGTPITLKAASPEVITDTSRAFTCAWVNCAYEIPEFDVLTPDGTTGVLVHGNVLSSSAGGNNVLADSVMRVRYRNVTAGAAYSDLGSFTCNNGVWSGTVANSAPSNLFEFYACAVSARPWLPRSPNVVQRWLVHDDEPPPPPPTNFAIKITAPNNGDNLVTNVTALRLAGWQVNLSGITWSNHTTRAAGPAAVSGTNWTADVTLSNRAINVVEVYGTNAYGVRASDVMLIVPVMDPPFILITNPNGGEDFTTSNAQETLYGIVVGFNTGVLSNLTTGAHAEFAANNSQWQAPVTLAYGTNHVMAYAPQGVTTVQDMIIIIRADDQPRQYYDDVLSYWPRLIGQVQTGRVEFLAVTNGMCAVYAEGRAEPLVAVTATSEWNLVYYAADHLPHRTIGASNLLYLVVGSRTSIVGHVTVVTDLSVAPNASTVSTDFDMDTIIVTYKTKSGGSIRSQGRTLFVSGGAGDKLSVKVKRSKLGGDGVCTIEGIVCEQGLKQVSVMGGLTLLDSRGPVGMISLRGGGAGDASRTRLFYYQFPGVPGRTSLRLAARKNPLTGGLLPAHLHASVWCGSSTSWQALKSLQVRGGDIGATGFVRTVRAESIGKIKLSGLKEFKTMYVGGTLANTRLYLMGANASGLSFGSLTIDGSRSVPVRDAAEPLQVMCNLSQDPASVTNWHGVAARGTFKKVSVKRGDLAGVWSISRWLKEKAKHVRMSAGQDRAEWYVNGEPEQ